MACFKIFSFVISVFVCSSLWSQGCPSSQADLEDGGTFSGECDLTSYGAITITGTVTWTSGNPTTNGNLVISGTFTVDPAATITVGGSSTFRTTNGGTSVINGRVDASWNVGVAPSGNLSGNGYITYVNSTNLNGTVNANFLSCSGGGCGDITLPVELLSYTSDLENGAVILEWSTASEINNYGFHIERSYDGKNFYQVDFVDGHGTTTEVNTYSYNEPMPALSVYYRLIQEDHDGTAELLGVRYISTSAEMPAGIFPNPSNGSIKLVGDQLKEQSIRIVDLGGKLILSTTSTLDEAEEVINNRLPSLERGMYIISFEDGENRSTQRLILE